MKKAKTVAAVILAIILLAAESLTFGLFSVGKAVSEDTIKESLDETEIISSLTDEIIDDSTVNMGGRYGEMAKEIMDTDAMENFFAGYISSAVKSGVYGKDYEEIADDELMNAFSAAVDEAEKEGDISLSPVEEEFIRKEMMNKAPDLTQQINETVKNYSATRSDAVEQASSQTEEIQKMMNPMVRIICLAVCILSCAGLIALYRRDRRGFLWCGAVTLLVSFIYMLMATVGGGFIAGTLAASGSGKFVMSLVSSGFGAVAIAGFIVAVLFAVAYVILKLADRRKTDEKNT